MKLRVLILVSLFFVSSAFATTLEEFQALTETGTFKGFERQEIAYIKAERDDELGAIVFSQGYTEHYVKWMDTLQFFYDLGYSVYMPDHRGQGLSGRFGAEDDIVHSETFVNYVFDLKKFIRKVVKKKKCKKHRGRHKRRHGKDKRKMFLFSHSMGGTIAAELLIMYKNIFDGAIFSSPMIEPRAPGMTIEEALQTAEYMCSIDMCTIADPSQSPFDPTADPAVVFQASGATHDAMRFINYFYYRVAHPEVVTTRASMGWLKESVYAGQRVLALADQIDIPIMVFKAGGDFYVNPEKEVEFCEKVGSNCTLIPFDMELPGLPAPYNLPFHELYNEVAPIRDGILGYSAGFLGNF